jgi:hypothetical protein
MEKEKTKPFEKWTRDDVELAFQVTGVENVHPILKNWLTTTFISDDYDARTLESLRIALSINAQTWQEQELIMHFIAPLLNMVKFYDNPAFSAFAQRKIMAKIGEHDMNGKLDYFVATGKSKPRQPFFCVHEYKYAMRTENDPLGQLLAGMITAQKLNEPSDYPILGSYIVERNWYFVVLAGKHYSVSRSYDATKADDLGQILACLHFVKNDIVRRVEQK